MAGSTPASPTAERRAAGRARPGARHVLAVDARRGGASAATGSRWRARSILLADRSLAVAFGPLRLAGADQRDRFRRQAARARRGRIRSAPTISARTCWRACSMAGASRSRSGSAAMLVAVVVGVMVGAIAGMSRGSVDAALMWLDRPVPVAAAAAAAAADDLPVPRALKTLLGPEGGVFVLIVVGDRRLALDAGGAAGARAVPRRCARRSSSRRRARSAPRRCARSCATSCPTRSAR